MGVLHYFLSIEVTRTKHGLHLNQLNYAADILAKVGMSSCNVVCTPVDTSAKLGHDVGVPVDDPTLYRSLAGAMQYLTFTRPDLSYDVQHICLHMHDPREQHFLALKRIIRYVQGTQTLGLQLQPSNVRS